LVAQGSLLFGEELRRRRLSAGLTIGKLAERVHYSTGQLSKVERGIKRPSVDLACLCDAALHADGELAALASEKPKMLINRRQVMTAGALTLPGIYLGETPAQINRDDAEITAVFRALFEQHRRLGQTIDPRLILPTLVAQTHAIQALSKNSSERKRNELLVLGSRYAEYTGWLTQEAGSNHLAMWWTRRATELATAGGDLEFAAYGFVRQALVTMYSRDARQTVRLAQQAQAAFVPARVRGLAALREAQGQALAADYDGSMLALDHAKSLLCQRTTHRDRPVIGTQNLVDPAEMVRGWCLYDLGRPLMAAEVFDRQLTLITPDAIRTIARFGARRALAYAVAGEVDHACTLAAELLDRALQVRSATIATDLRALASRLSRHTANRSALELLPRLKAAAQAVTTRSDAMRRHENS
jgi:transcriptional regulator with XRE-family HTH domain